MAKENLLKPGSGAAGEVLNFAKKEEKEKIELNPLFAPKKKEYKTKRITAVLPESVYEKLLGHIDASGLSKNEFLNRLIVGYLDGKLS